MTNYNKTSKYTSKLLTLDDVKTFSWKKYLEETQHHLPILQSVLEAAMTAKRTSDKVEIEPDGKLGPLVPGLGMTMSIILRLRRPRRFRLIQIIVSAQLYKHSCSQKLQTWFSKAGLCLSIRGARGVVDRLIQKFDSEAHELKCNIENSYQSQEQGKRIIVGDEGDELVKVEEAIRSWALTTDCEDEEGEKDLIEEYDSQMESDEDLTAETEESEAPSTGEDMIVTEEEGDDDAEWVDESRLEPEESFTRRRLLWEGTKQGKGYSITWDNVQHLAMRRHQSSSHKNTFHLWALSFMTENRIEFEMDPNDTDCVKTASSLPVNTFLPSKEDWDTLRQRMVVIVKRVLLDHFPALRDRFKNCGPLRIQHKHSRASSQKSHVINLGVYQEDPASTKGVVRIMENLQEYIPMAGVDNPHSILVNGDQLSVERMVSARMCMAASLGRKNRFLGMEPAPQEFHKRCLRLQDTMNDLYCAKSVAEKGTLYQIRTKFGHRGVKRHVMDCVNHVYDFFEFTTSDMLCLLALKVGEMKDMSDVPVGCPEHDASDEFKTEFFNTFAEMLVDCCWPRIYTTTIEAVVRGAEESSMDEENTVCNCDGTNFSDTFTIQCSAKEKCSGGRFYHPGCVDMEDKLPEDDWWCCEECKKFCAYCKFQLNITGTWIGCESEGMCIGAKQGWFHLGCVGLRQIPAGEWFCSEECKQFYEEHMDGCLRKKTGPLDHLQEYSCASGRACGTCLTKMPRGRMMVQLFCPNGD